MSNPISKSTDSFSIFIADDNEINKLLINSQLQLYCKNITLAIDGEIALSYLQKNKYNLIFLNLQMPFYNGQELLKYIKQENSINKDSPVIAITAQTQSDQRQTLIEAGFDECLIKPVLLEQLTEILGLWLPEEDAYLQNETAMIVYVTAMLEKTLGNTELAITLFNKLFAELLQQIQAIEVAIKSNDLSLAEQITHKLHGSVSFCGLTDIQEIAKNMELSLSEKNSQHINTNLPNLKNIIINFIKLKESILNQLS